MRLGSIIAVTIGCLFAAPCVAQSGAYLVDPQAAATPARDAPLFQMAPGALDTHLPLAAKVRLRTGLIAAPSSQAPVRMRARAQTAMMDFYPIDGQGFHLSAGARLYQKRNLMAEGDTRGLFTGPRGFGGGMRGAGMRRFGPAATMGYTGAVTDHFSIGIEAGARMGRAFGGPRLPRPDRLGAGFSRSGFGHHRDAMASVANLLVDYRF